MDNNTINRQAAIAYAISGLTREFEGEKWIRVSEVRESLQIIPSVEQQGQWILLTNELPEIGDRTLVTVPSIDETFVAIGTYAGEHRWYIGDYGFCEKVTAWLSLPKPYKEGE